MKLIQLGRLSAAVAFIAALAFGYYSGKSDNKDHDLPECSFDDLQKKMIDRDSAIKNVAEISVYSPANRKYWIVKFNDPPRDCAVKTLPEKESHELLLKANAFGVPVHLDPGPQGVEKQARDFFDNN